MKLSNQLQLQTYQTTCKNMTVVNEYITSFQQYTRNTVENILKLSSLIVEMKEKEKSGELDKTDMNYFCFSVGLKRDGSTFRKFEQIGKHSEIFWKYVDKLPDSYTVLYEITTLDPDKFEELMCNDEIHSYVTLRDVKRLGGKVPNMNSSNKFSSSSVSPVQMKKLIKSINRFTITVSRDIPKTEFDSIIKFLDKLQEKQLVRFEIPQITEYQEDDENVVDEEVVTM
ncbi:hypothetical protein [Polynucleobacter sp. JS-JIR-5-A7]|uniref:hypothetical protein n=1 Tax=Polynucleobacter sp. JS-JIR-5-A7 TaxID=1758395 RepID=UPI001BFEE387|nr:hypothetical protein [Polynucleobacter sp. JS-JIR-5-A7]QWE06388.1 hypothetical protein AOC29_09825 [Polynucleobacter sp. JS-JIR-5-A7]